MGAGANYRARVKWRGWYADGTMPLHRAFQCSPSPLLRTLLKIVQQQAKVVILYEYFGEFRQIFLDGRTLDKDPNPTWLGYSSGRWEGNDLVVETQGGLMARFGLIPVGFRQLTPCTSQNGFGDTDYGSDGPAIRGKESHFRRGG